MSSAAIRAKDFLLFATFTAAAAGGGIAWAQLPSIPGMGGGIGGLSGISSMGAGNAAGVLGYCLQNNLLSSGKTSTATSVLGSLTGMPGVSGSEGFIAGQAGNILGGSGRSSNALSLDSLSGDLKSQACNMVLKQAKTFL